MAESRLPDSPDISPNKSGDAERRASVVSLEERYAEARDHVPAGSPHGNLEWILGTRKHPSRDRLALEPGMVRLIGLWMHDLALDVEHRSNQDHLEPKFNGAWAELVAGRLRDATRRFLLAFRGPAA